VILYSLSSNTSCLHPSAIHHHINYYPITRVIQKLKIQDRWQRKVNYHREGGSHPRPYSWQFPFICAFKEKFGRPEVFTKTKR
jgi:hypothetical protein